MRDAETVMNNFMEKLSVGQYNAKTRQSEELIINTDFVKAQSASYSKLLESKIIEQSLGE